MYFVQSENKKCGFSPRPQDGLWQNYTIITRLILSQTGILFCCHAGVIARLVRMWWWMLVLYVLMSGMPTSPVVPLSLSSHIIQCVQKKRDQNVVVIIMFYKTWAVLTKFDTPVSWINLVQSDMNGFLPHLNNVSTLPCEIGMLIGHVLPLACYRKKLQNLFHFNCGPLICQIWIQLITACGSIAREGVQNTHHSSERIETATGNRVGQAGSCHHCDSHLSVASSIAADQWYVFCTPSLAIFPRYCYQLASNLAYLEDTRWDFWNFFLSQLNGSMCTMSIWSFTRKVVPRHYSGELKCVTFFAAHLIRKRCNKLHQNRPSCMEYITKTFWSLFFWTQCTYFDSVVFTSSSAIAERPRCRVG